MCVFMNIQIYIGTYIMFFMMIIMTFTLWCGDSLGSQVQGIICVVAILIFIFGFAIGLGAVTWVGE